ncbi:hypothetical protein ACFW31_10240 [Nocardiopsis alba]|uniref:hypothetical protein n=1 Tax=Nocardiopsis alba TaxID=53437 RepID=UPI00366DEF29
MTDTREQIPEEPADERWGSTLAYSDSDFPEALSVVVQTDPSPLVASGSKGSANQAGLSVLVTNVSDDEAVRAHAIQIQLKVSDDGDAKEDLLSETWSKRGATVTRQSKTRRPDRGDEGSGLYTFTYSGTDREEKPFEPGETVAVFIHEILVSAMEGATAVAIGVQEEEDGETAWRHIPLGKFPAGYYLRELRADTNPVEYGDSVTLTWLEPPIEGIRYTLLANREEIKLNEDHPQPVKISELTTDTTFELKPSWSEDVRDRQSLLVRVTGGDIAARNVSVKSSLTVREGVPLLLRSEWHEFSWCSPRLFTREATETGTIITNFQLRPDTGDRSGVVFMVEDSKKHSGDVYEVALDRNANWLQGYGFAYAYKGFPLTLTLWNIEANARPDLGFRPAFAYL